MSETEQTPTTVDEAGSKEDPARQRKAAPPEATADGSEVRSEDDIHAALAAWAGTVVGGITPEEARVRGFEPPPEPSGGETNHATRARPKQNERSRASRAAEPTGPELEGRVRWFDPDKGYGFIRPDEGEEDVFVHMNQFQEPPDQIRTGTRVSFRVGQGRKGKREAKHVQFL